MTISGKSLVATLLLQSLGALAAGRALAATPPFEVLPAQGPTRLVMLVIHGLNNHAEALHELYEPLRKEGATLVVVRLKGHFARKTPLTELERSDTRADWKAIRPGDWTLDWKAAATEAQALAAAHGVPLTFLGYSVGALVHTHALVHAVFPEALFSRQVLLAPAITIRDRSKIIRAFRFFGKGFVLPSFSPEPIRSHDGTSIAAYEALFQYEREMAVLKQPERLRVPTVVAMDPDDDLVSRDDLKKWIVRHGLSSDWTYFDVSKDAVAEDYPRHYIIDRTGLGPSSFEKVLSTVKASLFATEVRSN